MTSEILTPEQLADIRGRFGPHSDAGRLLKHIDALMAEAPERTVIQVLTKGPADATNRPWAEGVALVLSAIVNERGRQYAKWGDQQNTWDRWLNILTEELGEAAKEINSAKFDDVPLEEALPRFRTEMIQLAAVAAAVVQALDRAKVP